MRALRGPLALVAMTALAVVGCSSTETAGGGAPSGAPTSSTPAQPGKPKTGTPDSPPPVDPTTDPNAKPCTGAAGSLYALSVRKLDSTEDIPLCRFDGSVLLVVNVASHCGYTPQYAPLQATYEKYRARGFYVLGFPSNSFEQESPDEKTISKFCTDTYKITFPMFATANVNPPSEQPVYTWLKAQPGMSDAIPWNFEKFVISRHGSVASRFVFTTEPDDATVTAAIEAELAKP